jgi:hypothetical protein
MKRKIIQVCGDSIPGSEQNAQCFTLYALCDDGTVWEYGGATSFNWNRLPMIPQDESEVTKNEP